MASTLAGSTLIPSCEMMWPRNLMVSTEKMQFSLSVTPASCILSSADRSRFVVFLLTSSADEDVINVDSDSWHSGQGMSHFPVKDFRPRTDSKRKSF